ncbi:MAG: type II toxin-antitoxin system HipA family toxin [Candidatus Dormibacteria bacterium]
MASDRLEIRYGDQLVATIDRNAAQQLSIQYVPDVVSGQVRVPQLTLSLPFQTDALSNALSHAFLDGLLPEGAVRDTLERRNRIAPGDTFALLSLIGRDCAGAFTIMPPIDDRAVEHGAVQWLSEEELSKKIADLPEQPLAVDPAAGIRLSLGGAQSKMAVVVGPDGIIGLPVGTIPSTHILKPAILTEDERRRRRSQLMYPASVQNEAFCMRLAAKAGVSAAVIEVRMIGGAPALLVDRYDRQREGRLVRRLHQEDFCQALGVHPNQKYDVRVAPNFERMAAVLRGHSSRVAADLDHLVDMMGFNYLIGNSDAHGKNFALLHAPTGLQLAPAYDLLATRVYPRHNVEMAMTINGMADPRGLKPLHWVKQLEQMQLGARTYRARLADLTDRVLAALPGITRWAATTGIHSPMIERIVGGINERAPILQAVPGVELPTRRVQAPAGGQGLGD